MDSGMATACKGKPAHAAVPGHHRSERFLAPRWGASRFGLGTQGGAREAGLPWAGILRTVGAAPSAFSSFFTTEDSEGHREGSENLGGARRRSLVATSVFMHRVPDAAPLCP